MNSSDDDDIIETELSTDSETNLNTENQFGAEDANNSRNVTNDTSENEAKGAEQETSLVQEKANKIAEWGGEISLNPTEYTAKKTAETKILKL